ncbi:MAG: 4-(cytidine 5'-diphospho)-2-C-methyl-D-erythritol kinase [Lentisphaeria bacterium]|jgi:4-diphosphocytidyl-2-C-methyl-D-erythritol kinase
MTSKLLSHEAPAKLNLHLEVLGARPDGYHEIRTLFLPLPGVADRLTLAPLPTPGLELACSDPELPADARNLVWRAAEAFAAAAGLTPAWRFRLEKRIPQAAGLGGGSSDAAAALLLLNRLHPRPLAAAALRELAAKLGADVPFFLQPVPSLAEGIGERLTPVPCRVRLPLLLVNPGFPIPTPWAYRQVDRTPRPPAPDCAALRAALAAGDAAAIPALAYNAFDYPARAKFSLIGMLLDALLAAGCTAAHLCGSGATVFGLAPDAAALPAVEERIRAEFDLPLWIAHAVAGG